MSPRRLSPWGLIEAASALGVLATVTGFLGRVGWLFELTSHFKVQLAVGMMLLATILAIGRRWRTGAVLVAAALANAIPVLLVARPTPLPASDGARPLRLFSLNVHTANTRSDQVAAAIRNADADVVLLLEVNDRWIQELSGLRTLYPAAIVEDREDNFGIALFSRVPIRRSAVLELGGVPVPSIEAELEVSGITVHLLGTHPVPPGTPEYAHERNRQLQAIGDWAGSRAGATVVLGDLNTSPWSPYFQTLLRQSGLRSSHPGWAIDSTWPTRPFLFRIPLDHCLVSPDLGVVRRQVGRDVGSDHFPLLVDLVVSGAGR